jgi:hypothetical protein
MRWAVRLCAILTVIAGLIDVHAAVSGQTPDRIWLAGRYDRNRVLIYFDAVKLGGADPNARLLPSAAAEALFMQPRTVTARTRVALEQKYKGLEHLAVGDHYSLLLDAGRIATVTIRQLVASDGDEYTGNDSYVGALATIAPDDLKFFTGDYYAVRRASTLTASRTKTFAHLIRSPVQPAVRTRIATLVRTGTSAERPPASIDRLQELALSGGRHVYLANAASRSRTACAQFRFWLEAVPSLKVIAFNRSACEPDREVEAARVLAVIEIGEGRTGLVVDSPGFDGRSLELTEYRDGEDLAATPTLWLISVAE